ncbi:ERI1 exoribonuclease 2, partial [Cucurbita argyrosperma subsp. sororia]
MMALERKESMQRNCEASIKCLQNNGIPFSLQHSGNSADGFQELTDEISCHGSNDIPETNHLLANNFIERPNEFHNKPAYQHNSGSWQAFHFDSQKNYHCDRRLQEFQYFVVIDFEATCDKDRNPHPQEIIEFPSVIVSSVTGQLEACFQTYVRPTCNQLLSDFCRDLTGIQQIQVDRGVTLNEALLRHDKWLEKKGIKNTNFAVVTWSNWDCRVMLESECRFKKIRKPPYFNRWINLKLPFREVFGGAQCNLKEAVEMAGLAWQGRAHCGLDDAKNTARLLALLMHRGFRFSITNSLMWQTSDCPFQWKQSPGAMTLTPQPPMKPKPVHVPIIQYYPYCFCGVRSSRGMVRKPGPKQGSCFFGCGNWTATKGARCHYFEWASP